MPRIIHYGFVNKKFTKTLSDEQHQKIFDLLRKYNEDRDDIPKDLDSMYPHFKKVMWQGLSFYPKWKYWQSLGYDEENPRKIWQVIRERYRDLLKEGFNDVQIIRLLENEGWLETKNVAAYLFFTTFADLKSKIQKFLVHFYSANYV